MNRTIMGRQMFRDGGIVPMQYGGMAPTDMPPQDMGMPPQDMGMPPQDMGMAPPPMAPQDMGMAGEDEQMLMAGLSGAQNVLGDLDAASNVEEAINAIRQDAAPLEARRDELAEFVGPEDAARTPDSVLLMLQPVIIMDQASTGGDPMDAGVGGLAAGVMDVPVEGPMAEGIMSTVNMDPGPEAPMEGPPVNFSGGGSVRLEEILPGKRDTYRDQMGATEAELEAAIGDARNTAEANILFDAAAAGLNLAAGPVPGGSVMQNLAAAFSPVLANVPGRAAPINAVQADQKKFLQSLDLAALSASEAERAAALAARAAERKAEITAKATVQKAKIDAGAKPVGDLLRVTFTGPDGNIVTKDMPLSRSQYAEFVALGDPNFSVDGKTDTDPADADYYIINDAATKTQEIVDNSTPAGRARIANVNAQNAKARSNQITVTKMGTQQAPPKVQGFLIGNQNVLSYDNGKTYLTPDGTRKDMPTDAVILSPENAVETVRQARMRAMAGNELKNLYAEMIPMMRKGKIVDGEVTRVPFSSEEMGLTKNAYEAALKGIGPYKSIGAFISGLSGLGPTSMQKAFVENEDNRNYIKAVTIMGRAALVANPRFAVAELQNVAQIFPTTGLFTNPEAEANKLIRLKGILTAQKIANLRAIKDGAVTGDELKAAQSQNYQINMTLMMLGSTPLPSSVQVEGQRTTPPVQIGNGRPIIMKSVETKPKP